MNASLIASSFFVLLFVVCATGQSSREVLAPVESKPQLIEGLEFSVVTQSKWLVQKKITLQLRITNRMESEMRQRLLRRYTAAHDNL